MNEKNMPLLQEIKVNTIAAENIDIVEEWYSTWLDYKVCERGFIDQLLADSWNAPLMKNQPYLVLQPSTKEDKFIRVCKIDRVKDYKPWELSKFHRVFRPIWLFTPTRNHFLSLPIDWVNKCTEISEIRIFQNFHFSYHFTL